jgi:hypothetical protein
MPIATMAAEIASPEMMMAAKLGELRSGSQKVSGRKGAGAMSAAADLAIAIHRSRAVPQRTGRYNR